MKTVRRCWISQWRFHPFVKMALSQDKIQLTLSLFSTPPSTLFLFLKPCVLFVFFYLCLFPFNLNRFILSPCFSPHIWLFFSFYPSSAVSPSIRKAERKMSMLKKQREECVLKEEKTRHYLGAVISVAENISKERDQLIHMVQLMRLMFLQRCCTVMITRTHQHILFSAA